MKQFIRDCKECRWVAVFIGCLFLLNALHLYIQASHGEHALPVILRILDIFR